MKRCVALMMALLPWLFLFQTIEARILRGKDLVELTEFELIDADATGIAEIETNNFLMEESAFWERELGGSTSKSSKSKSKSSKSKSKSKSKSSKSKSKSKSKSSKSKKSKSKSSKSKKSKSKSSKSKKSKSKSSKSKSSKSKSSKSKHRYLMIKKGGRRRVV